jgi:hypothetical protein
MKFRTETAVSALLLTGAVLCIAPWFVRRSLDVPPTFDRTHEVWQRAMAAVDEADAAFARHDAERLRAAVTAEYYAALRTCCRWLGVRIEGGAPEPETGALGAELRQRAFRGGRASGDTVVVGFDLDCPSSDAGYPLVRGLKFVVLAWNGSRLQLQAVHEQVLDAADDLDAAFTELAARWLRPD